MWARPALKKGANVPEPYMVKERMKDKEAMEKHAAEVSSTCSIFDFVLTVAL